MCQKNIYFHEKSITLDAELGFFLHQFWWFRKIIVSLQFGMKMSRESRILGWTSPVRWAMCIVMVLGLQISAAAQRDSIAVGPRSDSLNVIPQSDSLRISVVTCAPGGEIYTLFGHTAIRVQIVNPDTLSRLPDDIIFNYGAFNYHADGFAWRFLKGETDYILAAEPAVYFFREYRNEKKARVWEQELNLSHDEKASLFGFLRFNCAPENRMYRYNWLYYNCTNRAKEVIDACVDGKVEYRSAEKELVAREILHRYTKVDSWIRLGIDFILGAEIDRPLTKFQQMFIPDIYSQELDSAVVVGNDGVERNLVKGTAVLVDWERNDGEDTVNWPMIVFCGVLAVLLVCSYLEYRRRRTYRWIDVGVSAIVGVVGCLVTFFFFFSEHPGLSTNWWVIIFNPLPLFFIPSLIKRKTATATCVGLILLVLGLVVLRLNHQGVSTEMYVLASILLLRLLLNSRIENSKTDKTSKNSK